MRPTEKIFFSFLQRESVFFLGKELIKKIFLPYRFACWRENNEVLTENISSVVDCPSAKCWCRAALVLAEFGVFHKQKKPMVSKFLYTPSHQNTKGKRSFSTCVHKICFKWKAVEKQYYGRLFCRLLKKLTAEKFGKITSSGSSVNILPCKFTAAEWNDILEFDTLLNEKILGLALWWDKSLKNSFWMHEEVYYFLA